MSEDSAFTIAFWSAAIVLGVCAAGMGLLAVIGNLRGKAKPVDPIGALFGAALLGGVPVALATFVGLFASAGLIALGTPPLAYLFIAGACLLWFATALGRPSYGMEGCSKAFSVMWSAYALVWSLLSFWWLGGPAWFGQDAASLTWLHPLIVGAPYAAAFARLADKKRRTWGKFLAGTVFVAAVAALIFFPVESGLAGSWLPQSDWLRFPLAALAAALLLAIMPVLLAMTPLGNAGLRRSRKRELPRQMRMLALLFVPAGFLWAAARALTA